MANKHIILYIPGLGDSNLASRRRMLRLWHYPNVTIKISPMFWSVDEPWKQKQDRLLGDIMAYSAEGYQVSLVGESAGASAAITALERANEYLIAVVLLCGKTRYPHRVAQSRYAQNPAFYDALVESDKTIATLSAGQKQKLLNLHPIMDPVVPVAETKIAGVENSRLPSVGHATSIVFACTLWSFRIVAFIIKKAKGAKR